MTASVRSPFQLFWDAFSGRAWLALTAAASIILITRSVGVGTYGVYATATGFAQLLAVWTDLGSAQVVVREAEQTRQRDEVVRTYLRVRVLLTLATVVVGAALVPLAFDPAHRAAAWLALAATGLCGPSVIFPLCQLTGDMRAVRNAFALQGAVTFAGTAAILLTTTTSSAVDLVWAPVFGAALATVAAAWWLVRAPFVLAGGASAARVRAMLRAVSVVGAGSILSSLYGRLDAVLLLRFAGPVEAGFYAAAYKLLDQTRLLPNGLITPFSARLAREVAGGGRTRRTTERALGELSLWSGLGTAAVLIGGAPVLVAVTVGPGFEASVPLLIVVGTTSSWLFASLIATLILVHAHAERKWVRLALLALACNVALNLLLIPPLEAMGAAIATVATEIVFLLGATLVARPVRPLQSPGTVLAPITGSLALGGVALAARELGPLWETVAGVAMVIAGSSWLLRAGRGLRASERWMAPAAVGEVAG